MPYGHTLPQVTGPGHILAPDRVLGHRRTRSPPTATVPHARCEMIRLSCSSTTRGRRVATPSRRHSRCAQPGPRRLPPWSSAVTSTVVSRIAKPAISRRKRGDLRGTRAALRSAQGMILDSTARPDRPTGQQLTRHPFLFVSATTRYSHAEMSVFPSARGERRVHLKFVI